MDRVFGPCVRGEKIICLCITGLNTCLFCTLKSVIEASGGSDVARLDTVATKTEDGEFYIVNGSKKWITARFFSSVGFLLT